MVYQPPAGARDLLPLDVAQKRWIETRLQQVFHRWGYHRIITSTLERLDTLMAGGAVQPSTVIQLQDAEEETLGLRPELTASIARAAVTRMAGAAYPQRLYYNANVFRRFLGGNYGGQQEFFQAGVELLGGGGLLADGEVLLLLAQSLQEVGIDQWQVLLGHAGLTRSLLDAFPTKLREKVRYHLSHLDRVGLENLELSPELKERALTLFELRGKPSDVLQRVSSLPLADQERATVNHLKSLVELLDQTSGIAGGFPLVLDLSLIRTFDYYTGIVFEAVSQSETGLAILGQGGRYDQLLGLYHPQGQTQPSIGFAFNLEDLYQVLLAGDKLPRQTPGNDWLVAPKTPSAYPEAFHYAQTLRDSAHLVRVELELGDRTPQEIRHYARSRRIPRIVWIGEDGTPDIESVTKGS